MTAPPALRRDSAIAEGKSRSRNDDVRAYAFARSKGNCEACEEPAPFITQNDQPYLEIHHLQRVSSGGMDSPKNVAAICPNCHRRTEYGADADEFNASIVKKIANKEMSLKCEPGTNAQ
ncbi:HNH endonuclease [Aquisalinus flavus]|uniref:HNH endonuclease n=1 Tax=Aquisalinus flavus TaxID=1526572 RepID=UPI00165EC987|nr:HNH endonuclease [Aquisalinus flavus]UNE49191.1 HNH endonuclease [Aquisalinus flavus]